MSVTRIDQLPNPPTRPADGHKGTFGHVLIIAGSRGMSGAACLSGLGALRGGAGLVSVAVPCSIQSIVAAVEPSYLTRALPEDDEGRIGGSAKNLLRARSSEVSAVAIGPGLGQSSKLAKIVRHLYEVVNVPMLVDADGLNLLARDPECLVTHAAVRILTPHPGEFARLSGLQTSEIASSRESVAAQFAAAHDVVLVLKGAGTVITDGHQLAVNSTGNSGMATGGTGDVLSGLIAALLSQGMTPFAASQLGVYLHGLAGDLAADDLSQPGLIASDLPKFLPAAWTQWLAEG